MACEFNTTNLEKIDSTTFVLPDNAGSIVQVNYADGSVMSPAIYTFMGPRLIKLSCPLPDDFCCLTATWTPLEGYCEYTTC